MNGVAKQIIGSFEDIGKDIARETVQVPKDVFGKAMESLGTQSQKSQKTQPAGQSPLGGAPKPEQKSVPPREWLAELAGKNKKQPEPTGAERLGKEKQEKNEKEAKTTAVAQKMAPLAPMSQKAKPGNLYGIKQKRAATENKSTRQD